MKKTSLLVILLALSFSCSCFAQNAEETLLRKLDDEEKEAILNGDTAAIRRLLSPQVVVQNPENNIVHMPQIMERMITGKINYSSFQRTIENIDFIDNMAILMGKEIITPQGSTANAGKTVTRRFTNIWIKHGNTWQLTARQATIVAIQ